MMYAQVVDQPRNLNRLDFHLSDCKAWWGRHYAIHGSLVLSQSANMRVTPYLQLTAGDKGLPIINYYENELLKNMITKNTVWVLPYFQTYLSKKQFVNWFG